MTIPSSRSLTFEAKSTWSELAFIHVLRLRKTSDVFRRLRTSSEDFKLIRESLELIVSSSKIPALPGYKSHAYISEKVGRYTLLQTSLELKEARLGVYFSPLTKGDASSNSSHNNTPKLRVNAV